MLKKLETLASQSYQHPTKDTLVRFGTSTIERWYYKALGSNDPIEALGRKPRSDAGRSKAMSSELLSELGRQYKNFSNWSYRLHADNLVVLVEERPELGDTTVLLYRAEADEGAWMVQEKLPSEQNQRTKTGSRTA